jgi:general stress protein 26
MDKQKVHEFLKSHPIGVLSTVDKNNNPHATTIYVVVEEDLKLKFLSKRETHKIQNIEHNNHIVLVVFDAKTQTNLQVIGTVEDISDDEKKAGQVFKEVLEITRQTSQADVPPVSKLFAGNYVAYEIKPKQIHYSTYQLHKSPSLESEFINLEF